MEKLTVIVPTGNEAHNIRGVLESVSFADEILVVDSHSTDDTVAIAKEYTDRIVSREYQYSASQKNWAIPQATHEWVLLVDADERVTPELRQEIQSILENPPTDGTVAYWIYRINYFMGERIHYSGWRNDKVVRLFRKSKVRYQDKRVHAEIIADGTIGYLKEKFTHNTYTTLDRHIEKLNRYAAWKAEDVNDKTGRITAYHLLLKPIWAFFKHYVIQMGFRDGVPGLAISYLKGYSIWVRYTKLWLHRKNSK